jgi:HlyD family secretion protein
LVSLSVKEGDAVSVGQQVAEISSEQIMAGVDQAAAQKGSSRSKLAASTEAAAAMRKELSRAIASRDAAIAQSVKAQRDAIRTKKLYSEHIIPESQLDDAIMSRDVAMANVRAAEEQVAAAEAAVAVSDAEVESSAKNVKAASAALDEHRANFADTQIQSPIKGIVSTKVAEQGEVLGAGAPVVIVTDLDQLYMKAYVPEPEIGRIKLGDRARVYVDSYPDRPFDATVREIAPQAEFTPKEVQTREERTKQVVAIKIYFDSNPQHMLVPGMPADAAVRWKPDAPWVNPLSF